MTSQHGRILALSRRSPVASPGRGGRSDEPNPGSSSSVRAGGPAQAGPPALVSPLGRGSTEREPAAGKPRHPVPRSPSFHHTDTPFHARGGHDRWLDGIRLPQGSRPALMAATRTAQKGAERLLNRELSWLDFNARVLELGVRRKPAAARAHQVLLDFRVQPGRVLHGARRRPHGSGDLRVPCPVGRTAARRRPPWPRSGSGSSSSARQQSKLWARELRPALDEGGDRPREGGRMRRVRAA